MFHFNNWVRIVCKQFIHQFEFLSWVNFRLEIQASPYFAANVRVTLAHCENINRTHDPKSALWSQVVLRCEQKLDSSFCHHFYFALSRKAVDRGPTEPSEICSSFVITKFLTILRTFGRITEYDIVNKLYRSFQGDWIIFETCWMRNHDTFP